MDDQFGGRTDDDLFADDFEPATPVAPVGPVATSEPASDAKPAPSAATTPSIINAQDAQANAETVDIATTTTTTTSAAAASATATATATATAPPPNAPRQPRSRRAEGRNAPGKSRNRVSRQAANDVEHSPRPGSDSAVAVVAAHVPKPPPPPSLAQSRHNRADDSSPKPPPTRASAKPNGKANGKPKRGKAAVEATKNHETSPVPQARAVGKQASAGQATSPARQPTQNQKKPATSGAASAPAPSTPSAPSAPKAQQAQQARPHPHQDSDTKANTNANANANTNVNANANANTRLQSGRNPRTKLTDAELNAKMEAMRIASAEKARRFEQAQRDERDHDLAIQRGLEESRRRKAAENEKRRLNDEDRKRMEEERARNRDKKLKAMKEWDGAAAAAVAAVDGEAVGREKEPQPKRGMRASRHAGILPVGNVGAETATATSRGNTTASAIRTDGPREFQPGEFRGRGSRGRRGGGGRDGHGPRRGGGRMKFDDVYGNGAEVAEWVQGQPDPSTMTPPGATALDAAPEEYPALPGTGQQKEKEPTQDPLDELKPLSPRIGAWDEDVEAELEAAAAAKRSGDNQ